ncbi:MAG: hypothetical protein HYX34_05585 [Actinobacteria bacterium]|nr:hypothetical protein [Actinomycetota bacterium]
MAVVLAVAVAAVGGCSRDKASPEAFCREARRAPDVLPLVQSAVGGGLGSEPAADDPQALEAKFGAAIAAFRDLETASPRQIRPDVAKLANVVERVLDAVQRDAGDLGAVRRRLASLQNEAPSIARAALRVNAYSQSTCRLNLTRQPPAGSPTSTSTTVVESTSSTGPPPND